MDAKPAQRVYRANPNTNNENMAPTAFAKNQQRNRPMALTLSKDAGAAPIKIPTKRTAFGDVSNVLRHIDGKAGAPSYKSTATVDGKAALVTATSVSVPLPALLKKDGVTRPAPTAGFQAPAQRPRNSIATLAPAAAPQSISQNAFCQQPVPRPLPQNAVSIQQPVGIPHAGAARNVHLSNDRADQIDKVPAPSRSYAVTDVRDSAGSATAEWYKPKRSPRHSKSQPCLKNADGIQLQQKKQLRRTLSRLPVDRSGFQDVVVFADYHNYTAINTAGEAEPSNQPTDPLSVKQAYEHGNVDSYRDTHNDQIMHGNENGDAHDGLFVDAVESFLDEDLPPLLDEIDDNIGRLGEEIESAGLGGEDGPQPHGDQPQCNLLVVPVPTDFIPAATLTSAMSEAEETWDDDVDFYDDQAYTTAHSFRSLGDNTTGALTTVVMPKMTAKNQLELEVARAIVEEGAIPEEVDDEAWDISMVAEYGDDINSYMRELEAKMLPSAHYMDQQTEIQWSMRSVLMEWLIQVHSRFNLLPETLYLTVNYIDRFLSTKIVSVAKLQLVGATAIFIAAKYEEIICPSIEEIIFMVDGGYTKEEILKAERYMLSMLGFELGWPGPMSFLRRISKADEYDLDTRTLAKYFLEVTIMDERFVACPPSFLAAGAHCLARLMLYKGDWSPAHTHYSGYTWSQVRPLTNTILHCCRHPGTHHAVVYDKYAHVKFKRAAIYIQDHPFPGIDPIRQFEANACTKADASGASSMPSVVLSPLYDQASL
ncbi:B-type cyclin [Sporothrix epigloea]|uniref:B-type cyclin n=1 Tax=Sporothrix epigloea TaxID=1892477 RepID=A0ABP0DUI5_9PEZI